MNVLVFEGPGVSKRSLAYSLSTLRTLLWPTYTIKSISAYALATEPWSTTCALLVLPGGRDRPYAAALSQSETIIAKYVREGGAYLGFCAGAYYACRRVELELGTYQEFSASGPLCFFNGTGRGCVYPGFSYDSQMGAKAVTLLTRNAKNLDWKSDIIYYNGGCEFVGAESVGDVTVIARYTEGEVTGRAAGVLCVVGRGIAVLWGVHPEYPLTVEPALSAIKNNRPEIRENVGGLEERRWILMRDTLRLLRLQVPTVAHILQRTHILPYLTVSKHTASIGEGESFRAQREPSDKMPRAATTTLKVARSPFSDNRELFVTNSEDSSEQPATIGHEKAKL